MYVTTILRRARLIDRFRRTEVVPPRHRESVPGLVNVARTYRENRFGEFLYKRVSITALIDDRRLEEGKRDNIVGTRKQSPIQMQYYKERGRKRKKK